MKRNKKGVLSLLLATLLCLNTIGYTKEVSAVQTQEDTQEQTNLETENTEEVNVEEPQEQQAAPTAATKQPTQQPEQPSAQQPKQQPPKQQQKAAEEAKTQPVEKQKIEETTETEDNIEEETEDKETKDIQPRINTHQKTEIKKSDKLHPVWVEAEGAPEINAVTAILIDPESGTIFYEKNMQEKMYPASMTKIMTALVVLDYFKADELITVGAEINEISLDSSKAGHKVGETLTVQNLLRGILIPSGNDSANVLAAAVARKAQNNENLSFSRCEAVFTDLMNDKAKELGAINTHFSNAHGYHDENHYSCAHDMALFGKAFMDNEILAEIASEESFSGNGADNQLTDDPEALTQDYAWTSHNLLVTDNVFQYPYATGIKTGFTDEAGDCLAAAAEKDGRKLIAVIFHSEDPGRWEDAAKLFEYGFNAYASKELTKANGVVKEMPLTKHNKLQGDKVPLVFQKSLKTYLPVEMNAEIKSKLVVKDEYKAKDKDGKIQIKAPLKKGEEVGQVIYSIDGKEVAKEAVYAGKEIEKGTIFNNIHYFFKNIFSLKGILIVVGVVAVLVLLYLVLRGILHRRSRGHRRGSYTVRTSSRRRKNKIHFK